MLYYKELFVFRGKDELNEVREVCSVPLSYFISRLLENYTFTFQDYGYIALIQKEGTEGTATYKETWAFEAQSRSRVYYKNEQTSEEERLGVLATLDSTGYPSFEWCVEGDYPYFEAMEKVIDKFIARQMEV